MSARLRWFIALVPVFPPLYLVAFAALRYWRNLLPPARTVILIYLGTQVVAALFTPQPLLSLTLALLRGVFVVALILSGVYLKRSKELHYLLPGLVVVLALAFLSTYFAYGSHWWQRRLIHPYYTVTSVGLVAALTLLIVIESRISPLWRIVIGLLALAALILSGSRGALALFLVGEAAAALVHGKRFYKALAASGVIAALIFGIYKLTNHVFSVRHFFSLGLSGRDRVWEGALAAIRSHPWGGVGPYQLGPWLDYRNGNFALWEGASALGFHFPAWAKKLDGAWLIAHDIFLHSLGESGVIGTLGFLALLGLIGYAVIRARDPLLAAIFFGYLVMGLVDNPIAVPSLFFAEVFWVAGGMALAQAGLAVPLEQGLAVDDDQLGPDPL